MFPEFDGITSDPIAWLLLPHLCCSGLSGGCCYTDSESLQTSSLLFACSILLMTIWPLEPLQDLRGWLSNELLLFDLRSHMTEDVEQG